MREAVVRAAVMEPARAALERVVGSNPQIASLSSALRRDDVTLLAEVKRRSPSKGSIAEHLDAGAQAAAYVTGGAAAISVLTEPAHFGGADEDLAAVRAAVGVPALKKDFHVTQIQLLHARALGASAALLIARAVSPTMLLGLMRYAASIGLETLVEVRDEAELSVALDGGAVMIGVNNRNLETLEIDPSTGDRLIPLIPATVIAVAESGVKIRSDVERYAAVGADAVLVGSSISAASDPVAATALLAGVKRRPRAG